MEILNTKQAADLIGITDRGVRKAIQSGHLPAQSLGRDYAILRRDAERYKSSERKRGRKPGAKAKPAKPKRKAKP